MTDNIRQQIIERALAGQTVKNIAWQLKVSKPSVREVLTEYGMGGTKRPLTPVTDANTSWCRGCGANVTKPCVLCRTRKEQGVKSGGSRGPASHDGRVVRQQIGRV